MALITRSIAAYFIPDQSALLSDAAAFRDSAAYLVNHWQIPSVYQMPLYPLLIAVTGPGFGQLAADIVLSVISVWLIYALAKELFPESTTAIFASMAAAFYPPFVFFAVTGLSEPLFIALVLTAFLHWYRGNFPTAAVAAVLAVLTRPIFDLFAPALVLLFALVVHRLSFKQALGRLAVYFLIYSILMTPWWLSNYERYGRFVRLNPGGGTVLYAGNNPLNTSGGGNVGVDYNTSEFTKIADPIERDRALRDAATSYIAENPKRFLELAWLKFIRIWRLWPASDGYSNLATILISILSFGPVLLLAGIGLFLKRRMLKRLSPILLFGLSYTGVLMILVGTIRYRLPLEPFLIIFSGAAVSGLLRAILPLRGPTQTSH